MRHPTVRWVLAASLLLSSPSSALTIELTPIGDPGNPGINPEGFPGRGVVDHEYLIGTYEVTNAQYVEFLNGVAVASDPYQLYHGNMSFGTGGIARSGAPGSYSYAPIAGRENMPVNFVSFYDALRFTNWLHNGMGGADTENGAYTLLPGSNPAIPSNFRDITRSADAVFFLPTENEWFKAAYYDSQTTSYFTYPTGSNTQPVCSAPGPANAANCNNQVGDFTEVGSYASTSAYGTFDQGGNVGEWNETLISRFSGDRGFRGGNYQEAPSTLSAFAINPFNGAISESAITGFRVGAIPEPGTGALAAWGLIVLAACRRTRPAR